MADFNIIEKRFKLDEYAHGMELLLEGELQFTDSHTVMKSIPELVKGQGNKIIFNLKNLDYIDSSGLGAILYISEALRMQGQKLEIINSNKNNIKLLKTINRVGTFTLIDPDTGPIQQIDL